MNKSAQIRNYKTQSFIKKGGRKIFSIFEHGKQRAEVRKLLEILAMFKVKNNRLVAFLL
jgi:hypothetical protein